MKRTRVLVLSVALTCAITMNAYGIIGDISTTHTSTPNLNSNILVIGNKAFNLDYVTDLSGINSEIANNPSNVYFRQKNNDKYVDVFSGATYDENALYTKIGSKVSYYGDSSGVASTYVAKVQSDGKYEYLMESSTSNGFATVDYTINLLSGTNYKMLTGRIRNVLNVPGAAYYTIGNSGKVYSLDDPFTVSTNGPGGSTIQLVMLKNDKTQIAQSNIVLPADADIVDKQSYNYTVAFNIYGNPVSDSASKKVVMGNTANGGLIDSDGTYLYYSNTGDSGKIYKANQAGTENYIISEDNAKFLCVYGNWIYYSNYGDGGKLYKVRTDGTGRRKISEDVGNYINVAGDKIYYINANKGGRIYVLDSTGVSQPLDTMEASFLKLGGNQNDFLYFSNMNDNGNLYQYQISTKTTTKVDTVNRPAKYINATQDGARVYYTSSDGKIYANSTALNIKIKPGTELIDEKLANINIVNKYIYYKSLMDGGKLYRVTNTGGTGEKLTDDAVDGIFIYANDPEDNSQDDIYYTKAGTGKLYFIAHGDYDSTNKPKPVAVSKPKVSDKIVSINNLPLDYFDDKDSQLDIGAVDVLKYLPGKVPAMMNDGTIRQMPVSWDVIKGNATGTKTGIYKYTGTVIGYSKTVTKSIAMGTKGFSPTGIIANNEKGKNDSVTIPKANLTILQKGDIIKIYNAADPTKAIKTVNITGNELSNDLIINGMDFGVNAGNLLITVTRTGKAESRPITVAFDPERAEAPTGIDVDLSHVDISYEVTGSKTNVVIKGILLTGVTDAEEYSLDNWKTAPITINPSDTSHWTASSDDVHKGTWKVDKLTVDAADLKQNGAKVLVRVEANNNTSPATPYSSSAIVSINPRTYVPNMVSFDESAGLLRGTSTSLEYSNTTTSTVVGNTTTITDVWKPCSAMETPITFGDTPVKVRYKATTNALPSLELLQVKITNADGTKNRSIVDGGSAATDATDTISVTGGSIKLRASVPATWKVVDPYSRTATVKATIAPDLVNDPTGQTAIVNGVEDGDVLVQATSKEDSSMVGESIIHIANQRTITVANADEFFKAYNRGLYNVFKLKANATYDFSNNMIDLSKAKEGKISIVGDGNSAIIYRRPDDPAASASIFDFGSTNGNYTVNLKNIDLRGDVNSPLLASDIESPIEINDQNARVVVDNVRFYDINKLNNNITPKGSGIYLANGTLRLRNNSQITSSNVLKYGVNIGGGIAYIDGTSFDGNRTATNGSKAGIYQTNGSSVITNNTFDYYNGSGDVGLHIVSNNPDPANPLASPIDNIGGVNEKQHNVFIGNNIGIWHEQASSTNGTATTKSDVEKLRTNNTLGVSNTIDILGNSATTPSMTAVASAALKEDNLNGAVVTVTIANDSFKTTSLTAADFQLNNAPTGVSITSVTPVSTTSAKITLAFDGTDFDKDINSFSITAKSNKLSSGIPITSNPLTITAIVEHVGQLVASIGTAAGENSPTKLVVYFDGKLYADKNGAEIPNIPGGFDVTSLFSYNGTPANYTGAKYFVDTTTNKQRVEFTFSSAENGKCLTVVDNGIYDASGNEYGNDGKVTYAYSAGSTPNWSITAPDTAAPVGTISTAPLYNSASNLVVQFNEPLCKDAAGTALTSGDIASKASISGGGTITASTYATTSTGSIITFSLSGVTSTSTITVNANAIYDTSGNAYGSGSAVTYLYDPTKKWYVSAPGLSAAATVAQGSVAGATKITCTPANGNTLRIVKQATAISTPALGTSASSIGTAYVSGTDIVNAVVGEHVGIYEVDSKGNIAGFKDITLASGDIKAPTATLSTAPTQNSSATLVVAFDTPLYIGGVGVVNNTDVASSFTATGGVVIDSAVYNLSTRSITFMIHGTADGNQIKHNTDSTALTGASNVPYAAKTYTFSIGTGKWTSN